MAPSGPVLLGAVAAGVAAAAILIPAALSLTPEPTSTQARAIREGDQVLVHLAFFDAAGRMMLSTDPEDEAEMREAAAGYDGDFVLPPPSFLHPAPYNVTGRLASRPGPLDTNASVALGDGLVGMRVGESRVVPLIGRFSGWTRTIEVDRVRGPFNLTMNVGEAVFEDLDPRNEGELVVLDDLLRARVLKREPGNVTVRLDVSEGETFTMRKAGIPMTALLDPDGARFRLRLDPEAGYRFSLFDTCRLAHNLLSPGTYEVTEVTESKVTLRGSPTKVPQLLDKDLSVAFRIAGFQDV